MPVQLELQEIIAGIDNENQIRIECEIIGLYKSTKYGAIVDTGFSGGLVLPLVTAVDIGLEKVGAGTVTLADGSVKTLPMFMCKVKIGNTVQEADTLVMGNDVLIGMTVLDQYRLTVDRAREAVLEEMTKTPQVQRVNIRPELISTIKKLTGRT